MSKESLLSSAASRLRLPQLLGRSPTKKETKKTIAAVVKGPAAAAKMGKSNKFDYTNRANSGAKLGHIIGTSLQKEAEKVKKDADRHLEKARRQSTASQGATSDVITTHVVDLKAPSKDLGDEGVCEMAEGLEAALMSGSNEASLALEDLNLSGNSISTISLARLAPIIELAKYDLKTLDLSGNNIEVETNEQAEQWESFLRAFENCFKLRRLDLSGNPKLGARAMEIFARVHVFEPPITSMRPYGAASVLSVASVDDTHSLDPDDENTQSNGTSMTNARVIRRRRGLRSIPYITLHDIGLNDAGALWLSYVVEDHHYPCQLIDGLNATHAETLIKTYQQDTNSRGIDWADNKTVGKDGAYLLDRTEAVRRQAMLDAVNVDGNDVVTDRRDLRAAPGNRRVSMRSIHTDDGGEHEATELESARRKLQRHIISHDGPNSVDLWRAVLKVFRTSRIMLYMAPVTRQYYIGEPRFSFTTKDPSVPPGPGVRTSAQTDSPLTTSPPTPTIDTAGAAKLSTPARLSYASKLVASGNGKAGEPELVLTEATNTPATPLKLQRPMHRKDAFGEGNSNANVVADKLKVLAVRDDSPQRFIQYQEKRIAESTHPFRDRQVVCHLPEDVMRNILDFVMDDHEIWVMNETQVIAAIERGQMRGSLRQERDWLKKDGSAQVWMLLDCLRSLCYGQ